MVTAKPPAERSLAVTGGWVQELGAENSGAVGIAHARRAGVALHTGVDGHVAHTGVRGGRDRGCLRSAAHDYQSTAYAVEKPTATAKSIS